MPWMTLPIALGVTGAATAAGQIYGTKKAASVNTRAIRAQQETERAALAAEGVAEANATAVRREELAAVERARERDLEAADRARAETIAAADRAREQALEWDKVRWADIVRMREPYVAAGSGIYANLLDLARGGAGGGTSMPPPPPGPAGVLSPSRPTGAQSARTLPPEAQAAFEAIFPDATLTPAMLAEKKDALAAAGFSLVPNAAGVVGKVRWGTNPADVIDVIQGAGSGLNRRQWLVDTPASGPAGRSRGAPVTPRVGPSADVLERGGGTPVSLYDVATAVPAIGSAGGSRSVGRGRQPFPRMEAGGTNPQSQLLSLLQLMSLANPRSTASVHV